MEPGLLLVLLALLSGLEGGEAARILSVVPFLAVSHQAPLRTMSLELAKRGHHVTFITTNPSKEKVANFTEVDISQSYKFLRTTSDWMGMARWTATDMIFSWKRLGNGVCEGGLSAPEMQQFIEAAPKFDLVIVERLLTPCFYGLWHRVGSPPLVGYVTIGAAAPSLWTDGSRSGPAYLPDWLTACSQRRSFWERLYTACVWLCTNYYYFYVMMPDQEGIQRKYFGRDVPSVYEVERNFSLMLINNHFSINYPRPNLPNMIELTGLHVQANPPPLPKDIQEWQDGADDGAVYFSLGSTLQASTMPEDKRLAFLEGFKTIPQRVLWKWEKHMADLPPDVKVSSSPY